MQNPVSPAAGMHGSRLRAERLDESAAGHDTPGMSVALVPAEFVPLVAWVQGTLIAVGVVLFVALAVYAIWWIVFRMGKEG